MRTHTYFDILLTTRSTAQQKYLQQENSAVYEKNSHYYHRHIGYTTHMLKVLLQCRYSLSNIDKLATFHRKIWLHEVCSFRSHKHSTQWHRQNRKRINGSPVYMMFSSTDCHGKFSSPRYKNYFWNIFFRSEKLIFKCTFLSC